MGTSIEQHLTNCIDYKGLYNALCIGILKSEVEKLEKKMKKVFLFLIFLKLAACDYELLSVEDNGSKITGYITDLIKDFNKKDLNTHDVAFINLESESSGYFVSKLMKEISKENPIIIPSLTKRIDDTRLRPASFVIVIADFYNAAKLFTKGRQSFESNYCLNTAKFIFVSMKPMTEDDIKEVSIMFAFLGALNTIMLHEQNDKLMIHSFNPFYGMFPVYSMIDNRNIDYVYPDKLKIMFGYNYRTFAFSQKPRFYKHPNGKLDGIDVKFMQTVAKKQIANFNISNYLSELNSTIIHQTFDTIMFKKQVDLTINTIFMPKNKYTLKTFKSVNTFDVNGFCAMIPYPPRTSFIGQMLAPLDFYTWIMFVITFGSCIAIWKMFNVIGNGREDSAFYFMFGVIGSFLLQSVPFRNNRIIQRGLLQICIFMTIILGNAYQSLIISLISESRYGATIKTFDELMHSNYNLKVDVLFHYMINSTDDNTISNNLHIFDDPIDSVDYEKLAANNTAIVLRCDVVEYIMYADEYHSNAIDYYYLLPDHLYSFYESFPTSRFSPFHAKLQYFSSLIFESGIRQHWKEFIKYKDFRGNIEFNKINNEEYLINFDDLFGVFYLLGIGLCCAFLILIIEITWFDCLRHLKYSMIRDAFRRIQFKRNNRIEQVRHIQVEPFDGIEG